MSIGLFAAALIAQSAPPPAQPAPATAAARWERFGAAQPGMTREVDAASIVRTGDRVQLRMRTLLAAPASDGSRSAVAAFIFDCRARTAQLEGIDFFTADGTAGRSLPGDEAVRVNNDDPMQRALFERACSAAPAAVPAPAATPAPAPAATPAPEG